MTTLVRQHLVVEQGPDGTGPATVEVYRPTRVRRRTMSGMLPQDEAKAGMWTSVCELLLFVLQLPVIAYILTVGGPTKFMVLFPIVTAAGLLVLVTVRTATSLMIPLPPRRKTKPFKDDKIKAWK
jgi:Flp pilus assembly protein TadB